MLATGATVCCRSQRLVLAEWSGSAKRRGDCEGDIGMGGIEGRVEVHVREQMAHVGDEHLVFRGRHIAYSREGSVTYLAHIMRELWAVFKARWHIEQMGLEETITCCLDVGWAAGGGADDAETILRRFCGLVAPMVSSKGRTNTKTLAGRWSKEKLHRTGIEPVPLATK